MFGRVALAAAVSCLAFESCLAQEGNRMECVAFILTNRFKCDAGVGRGDCVVNSNGPERCSEDYCCPPTQYCSEFAKKAGIANCPAPSTRYCKIQQGMANSCTEQYCCTADMTCGNYVANNGITCPYGAKAENCQATPGMYSSCREDFCCAPIPMLQTTCPDYVRSMGIDCDEAYTLPCVQRPGNDGNCTISNCCKIRTATSTSCQAWILTKGLNCDNGIKKDSCTLSPGYPNPCSQSYCCSTAGPRSPLPNSGPQPSCTTFPPYVVPTEANFNWRCDCYMKFQKLRCAAGKALQTNLGCSKRPGKAPGVPPCHSRNCCL